MFATEGRGPRFTVFGTPVTVDWGFAVLVGLLFVAGYRPLEYSLVLIGVIFVSVLLHELGHAAAFAAIGRSSRIVITGFGGVTISEDQRELRDGEAVAVSLAGPSAEIALGMAALGLQRAGVGQDHELTRVLLRDLVWVNLLWGLANLVPVLPLDGGHVMERVVKRVRPSLASVGPPLVSALVAAPLAAWAWVEGFPFGAIFAGLFVVLNLRAFADAVEAPRRERRVEAAREALAGLGRPDPTPAIDELRALPMDRLPPEWAARCSVGLAWALAWRDGPGDAAEVERRLVGLADGGGTDLLGAWAATGRGRRAETFALLARGFAGDATEPPEWYLERLLPGPAEVDELAEWIGQMELDRRHVGLSRLTRALLRAGRPEDAARVRARMSRPVG